VSCKGTKSAGGDCVRISKYFQQRLKIFDIFYLGWVFSKSVQNFQAFGGDFNVNVKDNYNAELVEVMKDASELDVLLDFLKERLDQIYLLHPFGLWAECQQFIMHVLHFVLQLPETCLELRNSLT
jgi:hypothetical protein